MAPILLRGLSPGTARAAALSSRGSCKPEVKKGKASVKAVKQLFFTEEPYQFHGG